MSFKGIIKGIVEYILGSISFIGLLGILVAVGCLISLCSAPKLIGYSCESVIKVARLHPPAGYTTDRIDSIYNKYIGLIRSKNIITMTRSIDSVIDMGRVYLISKGTDTTAITSILEIMSRANNRIMTKDQAGQKIQEKKETTTNYDSLAGKGSPSLQ